MRAQKYTNMIERRRPYHKTIAVIFESRFIQKGDDQWPHTDDVGYNIHKMRHTQVITQDGPLQRGARGHPISCLSAFQPIENEFGHGKPLQTTEHTNAGQNLGSQLASDVTHCPKTRKRLPPVWLIHR